MLLFFFSDFTIHCRDGDLTISKSALFLSSDYFRLLFTANDEGLICKEQSVPDYNLESVRKVFSALQEIKTAKN